MKILDVALDKFCSGLFDASHIEHRYDMNILKQYVSWCTIAQEKRKLLQTWVAEGENRNQCESRVVISRESAFISRGERELISIRDMVLEKKWPASKIKGIVLRGGGVPDADAPQDPELTQFWCQTKKMQREEESSRTRSSL